MWSHITERVQDVCCVIWCIINLLSSDSVEGIPTKGSLDKPCPPGFYRSEFLSGGCAPCVEPRFCNHEQVEDAKRCLKACGNLTASVLSTAPTTPATTATTTVSALTLEETTATSQAEETITSFQSYEGVRLKGVAMKNGAKHGPSKTTAPSRNESQQNDYKVIIVGIVCSLGAFSLLVVIIFLWYKSWKESSVSNPGQAITYQDYDPVSSIQNRNEEIDSSQSTCEGQPELDVNDDSCSDIHYSRSVLSRLPETDL